MTDYRINAAGPADHLNWGESLAQRNRERLQERQRQLDAISELNHRIGRMGDDTPTPPLGVPTDPPVKGITP